MTMALLLLTLVVLFWILGRSAGATIDSLKALTERLCLNSGFVGVVVLGVATSLPEIIVGITAVATERPSLSLGNLLGASFVLFTLGFGLLAVFHKKVSLTRLFSPLDLALVSLVAILPLVLSLDRALTRADGVALIAAYLIYIGYLFVRKRKSEFPFCIVRRDGTSKALLALALGIIGVLFTAHFIVRNSIELARLIDVPVFLIGLLLLGIGTNLPELSLIWRTRTHGAKELIASDLLGSAAANTPIAGFVALAAPVTIRATSVLIAGAVALILATILLNILAWTGKRITRKEGFLLLALYVIFLAASGIVLARDGWNGF